MEKTSKITKVEFKNEWLNPKTNTPIFYHNIELENGDKGSIGTKEKLPTKLSQGNELTYTIDGDKIKAVAQQTFKGGGGFKAEPFEHKAAGYSVSYAKDLVCADKIKVEQLLPIADKIYEWLINKKVN